MHHAGASILPAVLAMAERDNLDGRTLLTAAIIGYEASLRIGLATQPALFQRGFMATPVCGAMGAALAVSKCLNLNEKDMAGALGAAGAYAGGLAQFYLSGGVTKRLNGARGAESGVMAALLSQAGIWGPRDILEGEAGFFHAFSGAPKPEKITGDLGQGFRLMEVSTKIHAVVDEQGLPVRLLLSPGQASDMAAVPGLLAGLPTPLTVVADRGYDSNAVLDLITRSGACANIPSCSRRIVRRSVDPHIYRQRNLIERFFCRIKQFRRIATRFDKLARNFHAAVLLAATRIWLRAYESTT